MCLGTLVTVRCFADMMEKFKQVLLRPRAIKSDLLLYLLRRKPDS